MCEFRLQLETNSCFMLTHHHHWLNGSLTTIHKISRNQRCHCPRSLQDLLLTASLNAHLLHYVCYQFSCRLFCVDLWSHALGWSIWCFWFVLMLCHWIHVCNFRSCTIGIVLYWVGVAFELWCGLYFWPCSIAAKFYGYFHIAVLYGACRSDYIRLRLGQNGNYGNRGTLGWEIHILLSVWALSKS